MPKDTLALIVSRLLQKNKVSFDKPELLFQIQSHPSYPSLHAITGVLDHFKIENVAANIPTDKTSFEQMPDSFMAQIKNELAVVTKTKKGVQVYDHTLKAKNISTEEFLEDFTGVIVAVASTEESEEKSKKSYTTTALAGALGLVLLITLYASVPAPATLVFLALGALGLGISIAILRQEFGLQSTLGDAFCATTTEKKDCDAVLNSKGALVLGKYKFSDLSLIYFLSLTLFSFFTIIRGESLAMGYYFSLLALPITLYSIYYQGFVIKKWCMLCLTIVGLLWAQTGLALFMTELPK